MNLIDNSTLFSSRGIPSSLSAGDEIPPCLYFCVFSNPSVVLKVFSGFALTPQMYKTLDHLFNKYEIQITGT